MESIEKLPWVLGKYIATELLVTTGGSKLYHAFDSETDERLVIKKCLFVDEFNREVAISSNIFSHGNNNYIMQIMDNFPGENCLVMPYLEGGNLWNMRRKRKGLTPEQSFAIAAQIGLALQQVHAAGVIHNDLKSGNILLADADTEDSSNRTPIVKLTDFGLSYGGPSEPKWSAGTRQYMAPERFTYSSPLTSAVDIYSFGLVVHEMLTDKLLYNEYDQPHKKIPPHDRIPKKVLQVIRTACELNPANRYKSAVEMTSDLEKAVYGC
ncbi:MAG: serine/threonine-protein kinase [Nanoarchaeota archaeon]|nr:serine/threonine-protein kinase [Nanoarchaeota archaeon]